MNGWRQDLMMAALSKVQAVYDAWEQDENGDDEEYGGGGICDDVADILADSLNSSGIEAATFHYEDENHTVAIARINDSTYVVDIPMRLYESGSYYRYTKVPGVTFEPGHITVHRVGNAEKFDELE